MRFVILVFVVPLSALSACDSRESCVDIASEYRDALPAALTCSNDDPVACSVGRPMVVSEVEPDGTVKVEGLCDRPMYGAVSPSQTAPLDALVAAYEKQGCPFLACPFRSIPMPSGCYEGKCFGKHE